jgi:predicted dehydrogenase
VAKASRKAKKDVIKVGIIGVGGIARGAHLPAYQKVPHVEIVAVADVMEEAAQSAAAQFNIPHVFTDFQKMLEMDEMDAVSVCTPNFLHAKASIAALEAGKHVLCEKPLALNAKEGQAMINAAKRTGKKLMCGLNNRLRGDAQALKRFAEAGYLGDVYYARAQALRRRGIPGWGVFIDKEKQGGGPLIDIGVHILDLALFIMGHPKPVAVSGQTYVKFGHRKDVVGLMGQWDTKKFTVEDFAVGLVRFENGMTLTLESSFCANIEQREIFNFTILGDKGGCQLDPVKMFSEVNKTLIDMTPVHLPQVRTHEREIQLFVEAIREDKPVPIPAEEALLVTKILDGIYESSEKGKEVKIQ